MFFVILNTVLCHFFKSVISRNSQGWRLVAKGSVPTFLFPSSKNTPQNMYQNKILKIIKKIKNTLNVNTKTVYSFFDKIQWKATSKISLLLIWVSHKRAKTHLTFVYLCFMGENYNSNCSSNSWMYEPSGSQIDIETANRGKREARTGGGGSPWTRH